MKILMPVIHYYPVIGGLEAWTQNIAERMAERAEVFVITGRVKNQLKKEEREGVKIFRTSLFSLENLSYSSPLYLVGAFPLILLKSFILLKREKVDVCHCQGFLSSLMGYLLFSFTGIPYVVTVQRLEADRGFLRRLVYRRAAVCIGSSKAVEDYFKEIGVTRTRVIPNGIDVEDFGAKTLSRDEVREELGISGEFTIITVARLEKVKGIKYLISALRLLESRPDKPTHGFKLVIIGEGSQREELEALVKESALGLKVRFVGQVPNHEISAYLGAADCFALPSLKEGFGIVVLEAMAAGIPVVASAVGGILDIIKDGENGILVAPGKPREIAEAVHKLYMHPDLADKLVSRAFESLDRYDWNNIADQVYKIYSGSV
jgi:glycosyltransferase involved in cell wall biosynthesis